MIKIALVILFISIVFVGFSQQNSFPDDSATWKYIVFDTPNTTPAWWNFRLSGDTLIGNTMYQVIEGGFDGGFIRTEDNKVYFIPKDSTQAYIIYDFNLTLGAQFHNQWSFSPSDPDTVFVEQIDSVLTNFGYRKRWRFGPTGGEWIEGIGSPFHLTKPAYEPSLSYNPYLICFKNEGDLIYEQEIDYWVYDEYFTTNCDVFVSNPIEPSPVLKDVQIRPNPIQDKFSIISPVLPSYTTIQIYDLEGQLLRTFTNSTNIAIPNIPSGIYFLSFTLNQQQYITKIIKL